MKQEDLKREALKREALKREDLKREALKREALKREALKREDLKREDLKREDLKREDLKREDLKQEDLKQEDPMRRTGPLPKLPARAVPQRPRARAVRSRVGALGRWAVAPAIVACLCLAAAPAGTASAAVALSESSGSTGASASAASLESAATKAGETGRKVAISLIGLALAIAAVVLAFRRDFREAAAVFAVGMVCILLATPAGMSLLSDTVKALVGS